MLMLGHHPSLADGKARRVVLVEHLAPFAVDVMHLGAVPQRIRAVVAQPLQRVALQRQLGQRRAVEILGQAVRHVDAEPVRAVVRPETQGLLELLVDLRVLPVEVRLLLGEHVQVPLAVRHPLPCAAAENRLPVVRRQLAVLAQAVSEDVPVTRGGSGLRRQRLLEPDVSVGGVVRHDVHDHLHTGLMRGGGHRVEVIHGAQPRVHVTVVDDVVAAVGQLGRIERREPDGVHAQFLQVRDTVGHTGDVAQTVAVHVLEAARVDLVDHRLFPPVRMGVVQGHIQLLSATHDVQRCRHLIRRKCTVIRVSV